MLDNEKPEARVEERAAKSIKSPAFQFYPDAFLSSGHVQRMSLTERGAYITLLAHCWLENGLPTDIKKLAATLHVPAKQFERMWKNELAHCFVERGGKLHNERLDRERKKQAAHAKNKSDAANARWGKKRNADAMQTDMQRNADAMQTDMQRNADAMQTDMQKSKSAMLSVSVSNSTPPTPPTGGLSGQAIRKPDHIITDEVLADLAATFLEHYVEVYARARHGAYLHLKPARDFPYAIELVSTWPDVDYLGKMAELFLLRDAWRPKNEPGTVGQFKHMASQCDAELRRNGIVPRVSRQAS